MVFPVPDDPETRAGPLYERSTNWRWAGCRTNWTGSYSFRAAARVMVSLVALGRPRSRLILYVASDHQSPNAAGAGATHRRFPAAGLAPANSLRYDIAAQCRE